MEIFRQLAGGVFAVVELAGNLLRLVQQLAAELGGAAPVEAALAAYVAQPDPASAAGKLVAELGIDRGALAAFVGANGGRLALLLEPVESLAPHRLSLPFSPSLPQAGGGAAWALDVGADLAAWLDAETAGPVAGGKVAFAPPQEVLVRLGVSGTAAGGATLSGPLGEVAATAAFSGSGTVTVENLFVHRRGELALAALARDVPAFVLPGRLGAGATLGGAPASAAAGVPGPSPTPGTALRQYVHLQGSGQVQVGGSLRWSQGLVTAAQVGPRSLAVQDVGIVAGLSAAASFSYLLEGSFDLVIAAAGADRVRVQLARTQASTRTAGIDLQAGVEVQGLDQVGRAVLAKLLPELGPLVAPLAQDAARFGNLLRLLTEGMGAAADALLADPATAQQIVSWLAAIAADPRLEAELLALASAAGLGFGAPELDRLDTHLQVVVDGVKTLIGLVQQARRKLDAAIQAAAQLKVAVRYERSRKDVEAVDLALDVEIDPRLDRALFTRMLEGDFAAALAAGTAAAAGGLAAGAPGSSVRLLGGMLHRSGLVSIAETLSLTVLGNVFAQGSVLTQSWDLAVSATGELALDVTSQVATSSQWLWGHRTATFLADARVVAALVDSQGLLTGGRLDQKTSLELNSRLSPSSPKDLAAWAATMQRVGALADAAPPARDLAVPPPAPAGAAPRSPLGTLDTAAVLRLGRDDVLALLNPVHSNPMTAHVTFARALQLLYAGDGPAWLRRQDGGLPFLAWQQVRAIFTSSYTPIHAIEVFPDGSPGSNGIQLSVAQQVEIGYLMRLIAAFLDVCSALQQVSALAVVPGESAESLLARIRGVHVQLLERVQALIAPPADFSRDSIARALFRTLLDLAHRGGSAAAPFVTITRVDDQKVFVYG